MKTNKFAKRIILTVALVMILTTFAVATPNTLGFQLLVNGKEIATNEEIGQPYIENDRTMVPLRLISEALGFQVNWDNDARMVSVATTTKSVALWIDNPTAKVTEQGATKELGIDTSGKVVPVIRQDRTYVPLRFIAEALGATVDYKQTATNHVITVNLGEKPAPPVSDNTGENTGGDALGGLFEEGASQQQEQEQDNYRYGDARDIPPMP